MKVLISSVSFLVVLLFADNVFGRTVTHSDQENTIADSSRTGIVVCSEGNLGQFKKLDSSYQRKYETIPIRECHSVTDCPADYCKIFSKQDNAPMTVICSKQIKDPHATVKACQCNVLLTEPYSFYPEECYPKLDINYSWSTREEVMKSTETRLGFLGGVIHFENLICSDPLEEYIPYEKGIFFTTQLHSISCKSVTDCPANYCKTIGERIVSEYEVVDNAFNSTDIFHLMCIKGLTFAKKCTCALEGTKDQKCPNNRAGISPLN